ncbi:MAG TPA: transglutaminase-like cysteine peptidase [Bradyrhizobium sp.]
MGFFNSGQALRAAMFACGLLSFGPAAIAGPAGIPYGMKLMVDSGEPFGLSVSPVYGGGVRIKWDGVARRLGDERVQLALCDGDRERCASDAALRLLGIVDAGRQRDGRARIGEINRAINLAIRAMDDFAQYGEADVWSSPLVTFAHGAGDCEDYAIAKYVALRMAGIAAEDLRILVLVDLHGEGHAVAAARLDGHWLILDNRRMAMIDDTNLRNYRPLFAINDAGVMKYTDAPLLASLPEARPAPAIAVNVPPAVIAASY